MRTLKIRHCLSVVAGTTTATTRGRVQGGGGKLAVGKSVNGFGGDFLRLPVFPFRLLIPAKLADLRIIFHVSHRKGKDE